MSAPVLENLVSLTRRNSPPPTPNPDFIQKMKPDFSEAGMDFILSICGKGGDVEEEGGDRRPWLGLPVRLETVASSL